MKKIRITQVLAAVLALALAVGCAASPSGPTGGTTAGVPVKGGEFRINLAGEPPTIDPNLSSWTGSVAVVKLVFEGLLKFNQDLTLAPAVAKDIPSVSNGGISKDGLTYIFKLRDDVKWSDGKPVTAKDFVYSVKRMLDPKLAAEYASFYYDIKGAQAYNTALEGSAKVDDATLQKLRDAIGVKASDDYTLQFTLAQPRLTFLQLTALWPVYPVREDLIKAQGEKWTEPPNYIGNGPFKMTEWVHQDHITLVPNDSYYGSKPNVSKVTLYMVTDATSNYAAYLNGEREATEVPPVNVKLVLADPNLKKDVLRYNDLVTFGYQFNVKAKPFDNVKVRQAFSQAINREAFVDKVQSGVGRPTYSWIPPGMPGHDPEMGKGWALDPAKAKQTLGAAGFPDGKGLPPIAFQFADTSANKLRAEFFQGQIKDNLGVSVTLEPMEPKAFSQAVNQGKFQIAFFGWGADYPDPDNWLPELWGTGTGNNHTGYSNPKFDEVAKKAMAEPDEKKRLVLWAEAQKIVVDDAPAIFLINRERFWLVKPSVKNLKTTAMDPLPGLHFYSELYLEKK